MHTTPILVNLLAAGAVLVTAQESCPEKCDLDPVDGERVVSQCVASCNQHYGDPDDAQICKDACNDWQEAVVCEVEVVTRKRGLRRAEKFRHSADEFSTSSWPDQHKSLDDHEGTTAAGDGIDNSLEARSDWASCIRNCLSFYRTASLCPTSAGSLLAASVKYAPRSTYEADTP